MSTNQTQLMGGGGVFRTDPRDMPLAAFASTELNLKSGIGTVLLSSAAGFYTNLGYRGAAASITGAATLVTVMNITGGGGQLCNLIGPTHTAGNITTFEITLDGVLTVIAPSANLAAAQRLVLGPVSYGIPTTAALGAATLVDHLHDGNCAADVGFNAAMVGGIAIAGGTAGLLTPEAIINFNLPTLRFFESCKVEMMCSGYSATATDRQCGATYRLDR